MMNTDQDDIHMPYMRKRTISRRIRTTSILSITQQGQQQTEILEQYICLSSPLIEEPSTPCPETPGPGTPCPEVLDQEESSVAIANDHSFTQSSISSSSSSSRKRRSQHNDPLKRAEQNRQAQRAFRERKERYVADLEQKAKELKLANTRLLQLARQNYMLQQQNRLLIQQLRQLQCSDNKSSQMDTVMPTSANQPNADRLMLRCTTIEQDEYSTMDKLSTSTKDTSIMPYESINSNNSLDSPNSNSQKSTVYVFDGSFRGTSTILKSIHHEHQSTEQMTSIGMQNESANNKVLHGIRARKMLSASMDGHRSNLLTSPPRTPISQHQELKAMTKGQLLMSPSKLLQQKGKSDDLVLGSEQHFPIRRLSQLAELDVQGHRVSYSSVYMPTVRMPKDQVQCMQSQVECSIDEISHTHVIDSTDNSCLSPSSTRLSPSSSTGSDPSIDSQPMADPIGFHEMTSRYLCRMFPSEEVFGSPFFLDTTTSEQE